MSFLRHKEIYPVDGGASLRPTPPLLVWMSFQQAIPWRFALQHGPPPLRLPSEVYNRLSCWGIDNQPNINLSLISVSQSWGALQACLPPNLPGDSGQPEIASQKDQTTQRKEDGSVSHVLQQDLCLLAVVDVGF
jgi:hypothetical protein